MSEHYPIFVHRMPRLGRLLLALREAAEIFTARFTGPCGHEVNGTPQSWACSTCGAMGSSS